jgi:hypothetical protein
MSQQKPSPAVAARRAAVRRWSIRGGATLVAVVVAVATIGAAHVVGAPSITGHPAGRTVTPVPADAQRVCGGSVLELGDASGQDATQATPVGRQTVAASSSTGTVHRSTLGSGSTGGSEPTLITAPARGTTPTVVGSGIQDVASGDLYGIAASACADASSSTWLVGGSTVTGRTSLITLSNPTDVNATVDLDVFDTGGAVHAPGTTGIVVAPHTQRVVPLAGFVTDAASPTVHVTATGGQVVATMQESVIRTLTPGGVDVVQGGAGPSRSQTIPGVVLQNAEQAQSGDDTADAAPIVRVFVPGTEAARMTLSITTAEGGGTAVSATAEPGVVTDVPLDDFPNGIYSMSIASTVPVVAGARTTTPTAGGRSDLAWFASAPTLTRSTLADVVDGPGAKLTLVNPTRSDATVSIRSATRTVKVLVASGTTATTAVDTSQPLRITGAAGLTAGVTYAGADGIAGFPIRPDPLVSTPITVYP